MRKLTCLAPVVGLLLWGAAWAQAAETPALLSTNFASRAHDHVKGLSALGVRAAGTPGEQAALDYVRRGFEQAGVQVSIEPFEFESFAMKKAVLHFGERAFTPARVLANPYTGNGELTAEAVWVHPTSAADLQLDGSGKIIVTDSPSGLWGLGLTRPLAVVCVEAKDADAVRALSGGQARLEIIGEKERVRSANIVARLTPEHPQQKEVVLSAHLDSTGGPGANDNASGVATLLALAEHFSRHRDALTGPVLFVAFGAEEMGMQGAQAFIERHERELPDLRMLVNLDTIGASGEVLTNVLQAPQAGSGLLPVQLRHRQFMGERWALLDPALLAFLAGDYPSPGWLKDAVSAAAAEAGVPLQFVNSIGSDNVAFGSTGVPVVAFVVDGAGDEEHTPRDTADLVHPESLAKVGAVVAAIVQRDAKQ